MASISGFALLEDQKDAIGWARRLVARTDWVILDVETTNSDFMAEIVQIGILSGDGDVVLDSFVKPVKPIPAAATAIHNIDDQAVAGAPTFPEIFPRIAEALSVDVNLVVAYNAAFDERMLCQECWRHDLAMPRVSWDCAMLWYAQFWGDWHDYHQSYTWQKLTAACRQQEIVVQDAHSAIGDCKMTLALIRAMAATEV